MQQIDSFRSASDLLAQLGMAIAAAVHTPALPRVLCDEPEACRASLQAEGDAGRRRSTRARATADDPHPSRR